MAKAGTIAELPPLTEDERDVAAFRARDLLWAVIGDLFDQYREDEKLTFAALGRRIHRTRGQVQRWLASPRNLTLQSAGLLAEGLNADLCLTLQPRLPAVIGTNYSHPCEAAAAMVKTTLDLDMRPLPIGTVAPAAAPTSAPLASAAKYTWQQMADA